MKKLGLIFFILIFAFISTPILAEEWETGDSGEEVRKIQQYLYDMGYDISVDGIFGYGTKEVVKDFQFSSGLKVDGVVGQVTLKMMEETIKDITYIIKEGDTLSEIALEYDTTIRAIKDHNNMNTDFLKIGQEIKIPKTGIGGGEDRNVYATIYHEVNTGDVISILSKKYGVDIETIMLANNLSSDVIYVGQNLAIPYLKRDVNQPFQLVKGAFIWPVIGRISSSYGYRIHPIRNEKHFHGGIDIAVPLGTRIRAAAAGVVVQSGYRSGFGKTIVIDHGDGIKTLYAHNSRLLVRAGTTVNLGQVIALAGSTGTSTGSHLDFRIYNKEQTVNPINYLP
ncbi:MAG: peptidoglycan DD-metalloendopeptidase family protein [bacterium]